VGLRRLTDAWMGKGGPERVSRRLLGAWLGRTGSRRGLRRLMGPSLGKAGSKVGVRFLKGVLSSLQFLLPLRLPFLVSPLHPFLNLPVCIFRSAPKRWRVRH